MTKETVRSVAVKRTQNLPTIVAVKRKLPKLIAYVCGLLLTAGAINSAQADIIDGVNFPAGASSFADRVVSYTPGADVGTGWNDPSWALGAPQLTSDSGTAASLGDFGVLTLQFTDNSLTTSGDSADDLWIFEVGSAVEWFNVAISTDNASWIDLGNVKGQPTGIDIDAISGVNAGDLFSFVRLSDILPNQSGSPFGEADIDAVGAISSAASDPTVPVPAPATIALLAFGLGGLAWLRRRQA